MTNRSEIIFILDRSGSMHGLEEDTIGGFNSLIEKQKKLESPCTVTTVLFDDQIEVLHRHVNIQKLNPMTREEYYVRGSTALLDAVGHTILNTDIAQRERPAHLRAEEVMIVITTDGCENASTHFTIEQVKQLIERQKMLYNWEFIFLGANMDALSQAESFGIHRDKAVRYHSDKQGTSLNYDVLSDAISMKRQKQTVTKDWKTRIEKDYNERK
ncbi:MAG: hypothetical protein KGZ38_05935 [Erysipelothrix sp.]|jgi:uncharacterized protein YegL|nr:hypothetical protein [Erysipelothrix sp.]